MIEQFNKKVKENLNITLTDSQLNQLEKYYQILIEENQKYNLTTIVDKSEVYWKHFYDSLTILKYVNLDEKNVLDIGSGAGFPGIVLAIVLKNTNFVLVDSNNKKTFFLNLVIEKLNLKNVLVVNERCELLVNQYQEKFDFVLSRAVARLNILIELSAQFVKINGYFITYKAKKYLEELSELNDQEYKLGLKRADIYDVSDELIGPRYLISYLKKQKTAQIYPRQYAKIKKKPIS